MPIINVLAVYAPLIAITEIWGKRRRSTERNSNPDILGIFRSERTMSGRVRLSCKRASKPSSAMEVSYPSASRTIARLLRILDSSSTIRTDLFRGVDIQSTSCHAEKYCIQRLRTLSHIGHRCKKGTFHSELDSELDKECRGSAR